MKQETIANEETQTSEHQSVYLQWTMDGPKQGMIVQTTGVETDDGITYYTLSDKSRVNTKLVGDKKFIMQIVDPDNPYTFEKIVHPPAPEKKVQGADKEYYYVPDDSLSQKERDGWTETKLIPPKNITKATALPKPQLIPQPSTSNIAAVGGISITNPVEPIEIKDPFLEMMNDVELTEEELTIEIDSKLFPKDFFNMNSKYMKGSREKMVKFMIDKILSSEHFKDQLESAINLFYDPEYYFPKKNENE